MVAIRKDNRKPLSTHFSVDGLKNGEIPCRAPEELIVSVPGQRTMLKTGEPIVQCYIYETLPPRRIPPV